MSPSRAAATSSLEDVLASLQSPQRFLVTSHARPDGDAIGSALGMMHMLQAMGKHVTVAFADPIPPIYRSLPGAQTIVHSLPPVGAIDAAVLMECDSVKRSGFNEIDAPLIVNIDHHLSGRRFADINWIDAGACAVGEMVQKLAVAGGISISAEMATCLYAAILTDTGSFTFSCTNAETFTIAGTLVQAGANANDVAQSVYFANPASKLRLLGAALGNMRIEPPIAWSWVTADDMARVNASVEDCEGVVNHLIAVDGVEAATFLRQVPGTNEFRLSVRSKGAVDVARVAEQFGGGGHRNASGCTLTGPLDEAVALITAALRAATAPASLVA